MPVDEKHPLLLVSIYAQTKKQDWWGSGVPKGVPAQGNLTGVWEMIPDDLKPYTAIQLHGDDFIGHGYGGYGDHDALWAWYSYFVDQAEAYNATQQDKSKHINLYLTLMTGGTPISYLDRTIPDAELLQFLDDHECIKGVVLSENHNNGNTVGVAQVTAKYLKLMAQKGCYLVLTDIDKPNANMMEKWFNDTDELYNAAKKYHKTKEETRAILTAFIIGKKTFAIERGGKVIGSLGIEKYDEEKLPEFSDKSGRELGFVLSKEYWGNGYMAEAVRAVIDYLFEQVGLDFIACGYFTDNPQSKRVQEKCGFKFYKYSKYTTAYGVTKDECINVLLG